MRFSDFSLRELYAALDAQRQARGLSWAQAAREITARTHVLAPRPIGASTITGTRTRRNAEGDGVLQMLRWLNRTPESFIPGVPEPREMSTRLPAIPTDKVLRFDTRKLHAALDAKRIEKKRTWVQAAAEMGLSAGMLTHLANGGRTGFPHVMRMTRWLGRPAADFMRASDW